MTDTLARARARETAAEWLASRRLAQPTPPRVSAAWAEAAMADAFMAGFNAGAHPSTADDVNAIIAGLIRDAQNAGTDEAADHAAKGIFAYLGAIHRDEQDQWSIERAQGQRQLDDAGALMRETAELLRGYEAHHIAKVERLVASGARDPDTEAALDHTRSKARRNALAAARLEAWLSGEDRYPTNPADVMRDIAERMADAVKVITGVDHANFDRAADHCAAPVGNLRPIESGPMANPGVVADVMTAAGLAENGAAAPALPEGVADLGCFRLNTGDPRFDPAKPVAINGYLFRPTKEA